MDKKNIPQTVSKTVSKTISKPVNKTINKDVNKELYKNREDFVYQAQHPEKGILVVGEVVSRYQGWTEGAVESVKAVLNNKWIKSEC